MGFKKWLLILALAALFGWGLSAQLRGADIAIDPANRVANRTDWGACWWAAAESVGKQYGIKCLAGLVDRVAADGTGKQGANDQTIAYWLAKTGLKAEANPHAKTVKGAEWIAAKLDAGVPVIACQNVIGTDGRTHLHAFLLLKFDRDTQLVHYVDSNDTAKVHAKPYREWYDWWYGRAYAIDPKANAASPPGALLKAADPSPDAPTPIAPPPQPGLIPIEHPTPPFKAVKFPSNQDIKDGVQRPDDTLRYGQFKDIGGLSPGYDYYSEFRKRNPPRP